MYAPEDCFHTFPFPPNLLSNVGLKDVAGRYCERRFQIMQQYRKGLTATYNEFHDPNSDWPEIVELRSLHDCLDHAVLDAYGWKEIRPRCDFFPEFDEEDEAVEKRPQKRKYRYRWPDEARDEVLAKMLDLNRQRAFEEGQVGSDDATTTKAAKHKKTNARKPKTTKVEPMVAPSLFAKGAGEA